MGVTTLIAFIAGVLIVWRITLQITRPLHSFLAMAERIANGDLHQAQTSKRRDEPGQLPNAVAAMIQNLRNKNEKIQMGISPVSTAAAEIAAGISHRATGSRGGRNHRRHGAAEHHGEIERR